MKTFKTSCGCEIHVIKWSTKANSVTMQSCSLHKAASNLLTAAKHAVAICDAEAELRGENDTDDYAGGAAKPVAEMLHRIIDQAEGRTQVIDGQWPEVE